MINKVFFDVDETLIHTSSYEGNAFGENFDLPYESFIFEDSMIRYYTALRQGSLDALNLARKLVGEDNVYLLSLGTRDYIEKLNDLFDFGFEKDHIYARGEYHTPILDDPNNVLIDNLPPMGNAEKLLFVGIGKNWQDRYFQVRDFYGIDEGERYSFYFSVEKFLTSRHYSDNFDA